LPKECVRALWRSGAGAPEIRMRPAVFLHDEWIKDVREA
jgi:hypothetical protein